MRDDSKIRLVNSLPQLGAEQGRLPAPSLVALVERMRETTVAEASRWAESPQRSIHTSRMRPTSTAELLFVTDAVWESETNHAGAPRSLDVQLGALPITAWLAQKGHRAFGFAAGHEDRESAAQLLRGAIAKPVPFLAGIAEQLPFPSAAFDVVLLVSGIHRLAPGNDRVALWEAARVLRPGGFLILTFEVQPEKDAPNTARLGPRVAGEPLRPSQVGRLVESIERYFILPRERVPKELVQLTWDELSASLQAAFEGAPEEAPGRRSLTLGALLPRNDVAMQIDVNKVTSALLEGQSRTAQPHAVNVRATERPTPSANVLETPNLSADVLRDRLEVLEGERQRLERISEARFRVIRQQEQTLEAYRRHHWRARLRSLFGPRIGILRQYDPIPLRVPSSYHQRPVLESPPPVTIVTPTLNQGRFLERTIQSVLDQQYPALEYVIQDGASIDDTSVILERYRDRLARAESERDAGFGDAINRGFAHTTGEILGYLNSDDFLLPGALHYVAAYFQGHQNVDVVYAHRVIVDEEDREIGRWVLPPHDDEILNWVDYIPQETLFWRRGIWNEVGARIDESFKFAIDWDLIVRFREAGARFVRLPRFLGAFRLHPHQKTSSEMDDIGVREIARILERCHGRPVSRREVIDHQSGYLRRHIVYHKLYRLGILKY